MLRSDERLDIRGGFINGPDEEKVPQAIRCVRRAVMCTTCYLENGLHIKRGAECRTLKTVGSMQNMVYNQHRARIEIREG